ncbi:MAG: hypothetical protein KJP04_00425 [Arenicella sp.]|nr:hypothetical protein [Arenicella sp.]
MPELQSADKLISIAQILFADALIASTTAQRVNFVKRSNKQNSLSVKGMDVFTVGSFFSSGYYWQREKDADALDSKGKLAAGENP